MPFDENKSHTMLLPRGLIMAPQFASTELFRLEIRDENPQFFLLEQEDSKPHARPQPAAMSDEQSADELNFRPRWWPGAYLREV
jgi:hypothetical protein